MSYIFFAWATSILYGLSGVIGKISTKYHIANPYLFNFIWMFLTFIFILPIAIMSGFGWPKDWISIIILSIFNALSGILYVLCLYRLDVSVLSPIYNLRTPLVVILGVMLFKEALNPIQIILIGIIFTASFFIGIDEKTDIRSFAKQNMGLVLVTMLSSAIFNTSIKYASIYNGYWEVTFWSNFLGLIFTLATLPLFINDLKSIKFSKYSGIAWSTLFATLGLMASIKALGDNVSISITITALPLSMFMAIALSIIKPDLLEKHTTKIYAIRIISALIMVTAGLWLSR